jgi:hypothetical protein
MKRGPLRVAEAVTITLVLISTSVARFQSPEQRQHDRGVAFGQPGDVTPKVDAIFKEYAGQPGCNVGVARSGKLILERSYGLADMALSTC